MNRRSRETSPGSPVVHGHLARQGPTGPSPTTMALGRARQGSTGRTLPPSPPPVEPSALLAAEVLLAVHRHAPAGGGTRDQGGGGRGRGGEKGERERYQRGREGGRAADRSGTCHHDQTCADRARTCPQRRLALLFPASPPASPLSSRLGTGSTKSTRAESLACHQRGPLFSLSLSPPPSHAPSLSRHKPAQPPAKLWAKGLVHVCGVRVCAGIACVWGAGV